MKTFEKATPFIYIVFHMDKRHGLTIKHMESHYRRISSVKGRVDSSIPDSMIKNIKRRDQKSNNKTAAFGQPMSVKKSENHKEITNVQDNETCNESPPKWELYHTYTGRVTAQVKANRTPRQVDNEAVKVPFSKCNSRQMQFSMNTKLSSDGLSKDGNETKSLKIESKEKGSTDDQREEVDVFVREEENTEKKEEYSRSYSYRLQLAERNTVMRHQLEDRLLEYKYLQFLSEITKDILSRNVTSDSELLVIFKSHVTANKQHLREDVLWQKIAQLKQQLGLTQTGSETGSYSLNN